MLSNESDEVSPAQNNMQGLASRLEVSSMNSELSEDSEVVDWFNQSCVKKFK